jgi:hypothetical protein
MAAQSRFASVAEAYIDLSIIPEHVEHTRTCGNVFDNDALLTEKEIDECFSINYCCPFY